MEELPVLRPTYVAISTVYGGLQNRGEAVFILSCCYLAAHPTLLLPRTTDNVGKDKVQLFVPCGEHPMCAGLLEFFISCRDQFVALYPLGNGNICGYTLICHWSVRESAERLFDLPNLVLFSTLWPPSVQEPNVAYPTSRALP